MPTNDTPRTTPRIALTDATSVLSGFIQGLDSEVGPEFYRVRLDDNDIPVAVLILTPQAVIALAAELDDLRGDAELLLRQQAITEGRAAA